MTKTEFNIEASKININPNVYGLTLNATFYARGWGQVTGGKAIGIKWHDEWVTKEETDARLAAVNGRTYTALGKVPYVVLKKGKSTYEVKVWKIRAHLNDLFNKFLIDMGKAQAQEKKESKKTAKSV